MTINKLDVYYVATDFLDLPLRSKVEIAVGLGFEKNIIYLPESEIVDKVWEKANKNYDNFMKFIELLDNVA